MSTELKISKSLFWDVDVSEIDYEKNATQIIERVLTRGSLEDWFAIKAYYGLERLKSEAIAIRYLDKITLNFCSVFFHIPKENFKCYNTPQSYQQLWNY